MSTVIDAVISPAKQLSPREMLIRNVSVLGERHRAVATLNFRYPPDRSPAEAEDFVRTLVPTDATVEIVGNSPPGDVAVDAPLVRRLLDQSGLPIEPKQAWTNVADFTSRGIPAINFGPGATRYAHRRDERVEIAALEQAYEALRRLVVEPIV